MSIALTMNFYKSDPETRKVRADGGAAFGPEGCRQALSGGGSSAAAPPPLTAPLLQVGPHSRPPAGTQADEFQHN